ncbi:uncharacterized protein C5L36_0D06450 [Pichia kudriavzevii]|uniref:peptide chain release factor N(5)-glutamine methyltransferase n=2 Tax=Pichia kudriavzevii TaxID=4909 RepID=A0A2U9RAM6_PICKU|nr:uncharacterized protein C5L36_0D06450 [Pichia kudriavzevii]AWU77919.1 hypothetical protein C5L36_0D06450 [Pichia kudriavzevii]
MMKVRQEMSRLLIESMVRTISKSFPLEQARREAMWISKELPQSQWINASKKRSQLVPLQYILGTQPFGKLDLMCKPGVLIPRLDTEEWVLESASLLQHVQIDRIIDYCTGSGCIGLGYASELVKVGRIDMIDYKNDAIKLSTDNSIRNEVDLNIPVSIKEGNLLQGFLPMDPVIADPARNNILVSNPPYIPEGDLHGPEVEPSVSKYEPADALLGDLEFYEALCDKIINPFPSFKGFIFELGYFSQAKLVSELLNRNEWTIGIRNDSSGNLRNVIGWRKHSEFKVLEGMINKCL